MRYLALVVAVLVLVLPAGCKKEAPPAKSTIVNVSPVISGIIVDELTLVGQAKAMDSVNLIARVNGYLIKQNFREGEFVRQGTLLYEIEPEKYEADLKTAEAKHQRALAEKTNADSDYKRQESLYKGDAVSERVRDEAMARKMEADANVRSAEADIANAKLQLSYTKIYAPFDGRVGLRNFSVGNVVAPESGPLLTIKKIDPINIQFSVSELSLLKIQQASGKDRIEEADLRIRLFLQNGMEYNHEGKIVKWDNRVNPMTGMLKLEAEFPNPNWLLVDGMYVKVQIAPKKDDKSLLIPRQAIMDTQGAKYVYVVNKENVIERRGIEVGTNDEIFIVVEKGVTEGESIVVEGTQKVYPKVKVEPKTDERFASQAAAEKLYEIKRPQMIRASSSKEPAKETKAVPPKQEAAKEVKATKPAEAKAVNVTSPKSATEQPAK